jgi:hypothetical protein
VGAFNWQFGHLYKLIIYLKKIHCILVQHTNRKEKPMTNKKTVTRSAPGKKNRNHPRVETETGFKKLLTVSGCSEHTANELLKWYTI